MSLFTNPARAQKGYPITPVPFTQVKVTPGTFWGQRLQASREVTVPLAFSKCESEGPWGGCRVPKSWRILYQDSEGQWQPVSGADHYPTDKGSACTVNFDPVSTKALRLEVILPVDHSAGLYEWIVR